MLPPPLALHTGLVPFEDCILKCMRDLTITSFKQMFEEVQQKTKLAELSGLSLESILERKIVCVYFLHCCKQQCGKGFLQPEGEKYGAASLLWKSYILIFWKEMIIFHETKQQVNQFLLALLQTPAEGGCLTY